MRRSDQERGWFWATLALSSVSIVGVAFAAWEVVENRLFSHVDYVTLHYLYITRGILTSLLLAFWAAWYVLRERVHAEEALRRSHERYRGLIEASPGAVALYGGDLRTTEWNAAAEQLYGWSRDQVLGNALPTVASPVDQQLRDLMRQVADGSPVLGFETFRVARSGEQIAVQLSLIPFRDPGGQALFLEVTEDIRERVRMRDQMLEIEKLASMGKMAAGTAHHLNTPLAAMLLRVQMMRESEPAEPLASDLRHLEEGIHFCQQFVRRLLDFSRRPPVIRQPENINRTVASILAFLAPAIRAKNAAVSTDLSAAEEAFVLADRNLLEVLFSTVLSNALDAISAGGQIRIACPPPRGGLLEIRVWDNGCGITPADRSHIFEPFFTTKPPGKGTGLGLAIARNIVFEHGGDMRIESEPGSGTTVVIDLPVHREAVLKQEVSA